MILFCEKCFYGCKDIGEKRIELKIRPIDFLLFLHTKPLCCIFIVYNNHVGYSLNAQTQRKVLPQMKWSVLNLTTDGEIISRNS
jgi:hypothetical protein